MAVDLARQNAERGGRPFASVIVKDGKVVATAVNSVVATGDPTAHAETEAIRAAAKALKSDQLDGCVIYASGHPCPMCLAAMYVSGIQRGFYAYSIDDVPDDSLRRHDVRAVSETDTRTKHQARAPSATG